MLLLKFDDHRIIIQAIQGRGGRNAGIHAERFTTFLKAEVPQSHFKMIFKALLIHILSIHVTSVFPVSPRV